MVTTAVVDDVPVGRFMGDAHVHAFVSPTCTSNVLFVLPCFTFSGFEPGFAPDLSISPYLKLLPMLMGIGSEGTIQEVGALALGHECSA